jgi:cytochrome c oxidase subunit 2
MSSSPRSGPSQTAIFALAVGALIVGVSVLLAAIGVNVLKAGGDFVGGLYPPIAVTEQGAKIRDLYTIVFLIAVGIFIVVEGLIIWSVIRYRRKPGDDTLPPQTHGNNIAELVWTVVPTLIVAFMFVISWQTLNAVDTNSANAETKMRAVAGQFQWQFDYLSPDGGTILYTQIIPSGDDGGMVVPAGRTIQLSLVSNDVIHAFYVPQFLFKRDVVPGRVNQFDFKVNDSDAGQTFRGQCAELCGTGHSIMLFEVKAMTGAQFDQWLADKIAKANASPPPAPSPGPSGSGSAPGATVQVSASGVKFEQTAITAPAGAPFQIVFENKDPATAHDIAIRKDSATGEEVFKGEAFPGVATKTYDVPALPAGSYTFICTIHPTMTGTLTVQ